MTYGSLIYSIFCLSIGGHVSMGNRSRRDTGHALSIRGFEQLFMIRDPAFKFLCLSHGTDPQCAVIHKLFGHEGIKTA